MLGLGRSTIRVNPNFLLLAHPLTNLFEKTILHARHLIRCHHIIAASRKHWLLLLLGARLTCARRSLRLKFFADRTLRLGRQFHLVARVLRCLMVWLPVLIHRVLLVKLLGVLVAPEHHLLEFLPLPAIHLQRPDEGDMDTHGAVLARALVAQEDADV